MEKMKLTAAQKEVIRKMRETDSAIIHGFGSFMLSGGNGSVNGNTRNALIKLGIVECKQGPYYLTDLGKTIPLD